MHKAPVLRRYLLQKSRHFDLPCNSAQKVYPVFLSHKFISGGEFQGHVDYGDGNVCSEEATHALVFMVVALNNSWKLPIAHFFTSSIRSEIQANLLTLAISYVNETGALLTNITCDNAATNLSSLRLLGANVSNHLNLKVSLDLTNVMNIPILVVLDPCHILKLVRGTLHDCGIIYSTEESAPAMWQHISCLHDLQSAEGLHLGNKLTASHVHYGRQKMKVYLAAQVISNSVADALEYCQAKVKGWEDRDVSGTCRFLRVFNMLFDRMNSRNPFGKFLKSPFSAYTKDEILQDFSVGEAFILSLGTQQPQLGTANYEPQSKKSKPESLVLNGPRKKGFIGFLVNIATFKKMYELYVQTGYLQYLLTYKTSQAGLKQKCFYNALMTENNSFSTGFSFIFIVSLFSQNI